MYCILLEATGHDYIVCTGSTEGDYWSYRKVTGMLLDQYKMYQRDVEKEGLELSESNRFSNSLLSF
jgi:hypothetical protein